MGHRQDVRRLAKEGRVLAQPALDPLQSTAHELVIEGESHDTHNKPTIISTTQGCPR